MRVLTIAGRWLVAVLGLSVLCIVLALGFFNPNARRSEIEAWVSEQTGRRFTVEGELGWRVWPRLSVTLPHTLLAAAPAISTAGFASGPFAEWQQASISVRLWPLLRGRLEFGAVRLQGLRVYLQRDMNGQRNWQDLLQLLSGDESPGRFKFTSLAGLQVDDAQITFEDAAAKRVTTLRIASLNTTAVAYLKPVSVAIEAQATTRNQADNGAAAGAPHSDELDLAFTVTLRLQTDSTLQHVQLDDLQFAAKVNAAGVPVSGTKLHELPVTVRLDHADWQVAQQLLQLNAVRGSVGAAQLMLDRVRITSLQIAPQIAATVQVEVPDLRQWLQHLAITVPATRDAAVLQQLSAHMQVTGSEQELRFQVMLLLLDQTRCRGEVRLLRSGDTAGYAIDLHADQVNLDRYLPIAAPASVLAKSRQSIPSPVPIEWLRSLHAQGKLMIDRAQWQGIHAQHLTIALDGA